MTRTTSTPASPAYDKTRPLIGFDGTEHDSEAEARESFVYGPIGVHRCTEALPAIFVDPAGATFQRLPDFRADRRRYSVYVELKTYLNDQPDKATAKAAEAGYRPPGRSDQWHVAETSWSNSVVNNAIVQRTLDPGAIVVTLPDENFKLRTRGKRKGKLPETTVTTVNRLEKHGVFWLKSSELQGYLRCRDLLAAVSPFLKPQPPQEPPLSIEVRCRNSEALEIEIESLKAQGYRLKRGSKKETSAVLTLKKKASASPALH